MSGITEGLTAALADRYRIERRLGEGGMATVFLAEDLKHKRKVAVKVLRPELAAVLGGERFVQEIETTAALQHPNILPLFDSGQAAGFLYYVMPYVEGETLRDKLDKETQLGIGEAVRFTCEVADALDYAHRQGVVHRDIKPENVLLQDGRPLVADFGIALAVSAAAGGRMTETGLSLGTPHYMSPEQATAEKDLTARSDIYSLGSMLYEMLTGSPPHVGASAQQIIMKIVTEEAAPVTNVRKSVPANVAAAVGTSLEKLPADRFESAKAFAVALRNPSYTAAGAGLEATAASPATRRGVPLPMAAGVGVALLGLAMWGWLRPGPAPAVTRYGLAFPPEQAPLFYATPVPLSDGSLLYLGHEGGGGAVGGNQVWRKPREAYVAAPIEGTAGTNGFAVSPDESELVVTGGAQGPRRLPLAGGAALPLGISPPVRDPAWLDDGKIVFVDPRPPMRLLQVRAQGGEPSVLYTSGDEGETLSMGDGVPGGGVLLFEACERLSSGTCVVRALDVESLEVEDLLPGRWPRFSTTGHVLYWFAESVFAVRFDTERMEVSGTPVAVLTGVADVGGAFRLSRPGTLVMRAPGASVEMHEMVWIDRTGAETPVDPDWSFDPIVRGGNAGWALSPDGSRLAIGLVTDAGQDLWIRDLDGGRFTRLTLEEGVEARPRWTPDGASVTYVAQGIEGQGLYERRADGTGSPTLLFRDAVSEGVRHPDGEWLVLRYGVATPAAGGRDITGIRPGVDSVPTPLRASPFDESAFALSPDGRWLAYQSDEAGALNVFVVPFPETDSGRWQVSEAGGRGALWSRDGSELFYVSPEEEMMAVSVSANGTALELGRPEALFRIPDTSLAGELGRFYTQWDVAPDGRFIMAKRLDDLDPGAIIVVENFDQELKARLGG